MKKDIHPKYYKGANVKCSCGNNFRVGSTKENIEVEVCSACHPFYTGDEKGKMRGSQVEKFRERMTKKKK
ncbi:MAG: 50S ribosomal protein L31 [Candidatus Spechtbacterales bacterium]